MSSAADEIIIGLIQAHIRAGANVVRIPASLAVEMTKEGRQAAGDLCEINEVQLEVLADE